MSELKRGHGLASPSGMALTTSYDYDAFGPFQVTEPSGGITIIVKEAPGGAHRDPKLTGENIRAALRRHLADLKKMSPADLVRDRYQKYRAMGMFTQEE